jgi:hypothetical protein
MDSATKEVLLNLLRNLTDSVDTSYHCSEMAWRTFAALSQMFPERFPAEYQQATGATFEQLSQWRADQIRKLAAAIQLLESLP